MRLSEAELNRLLCESAESAGVEIVADKINRRGGVCRLEGRLMVVFDVGAGLSQRNRLLIQALRLLGPEVYLPPKVRELLDAE
ncbi:MAG: hypothetical protein BWY87_00753 [Deltaproteobacteria bacterium ADurb.Bin510]|jgi:hypothetical protein|nr:MAG: hypothetical protein BWY87_00753 [Deltaproteobacteria bacterium ADurb.Bin510]